MTELVMNYTINPIWLFLKKSGSALIRAQEAAGRARAASQLANMGYYKEAKALMLQGAKKNG